MDPERSILSRSSSSDPVARLTYHSTACWESLLVCDEMEQLILTRLSSKYTWDWLVFWTRRLLSAENWERRVKEKVKQSFLWVQEKYEHWWQVHNSNSVLWQAAASWVYFWWQRGGGDAQSAQSKTRIKKEMSGKSEQRKWEVCDNMVET